MKLFHYKLVGTFAESDDDAKIVLRRLCKIVQNVFTIIYSNGLCTVGVTDLFIHAFIIQ